jgi:catechol 2,3-dioxygenase-like lactoylglutathione lyase family enzyme
MLDGKKAFSSFAVNDTAAAKQFYGETLGLDIEENEMGLQLKAGDGNGIFIYIKSNHQPADYTILNLPVEDIDQAVEELAEKGVAFEHYDEEQIKTDEKGVARGRTAGRGPDIAWFRDPAGNILSILQN